MDSWHSEILIVGGGPAGGLAGFLLAKAGFRVLLIDADRTRRRKVCGEFLCHEGMEVLRHAGLFHVIENNGFLPAEGVRIFTAQGVPVSGWFPQRAQHEPGGYCLDRAVFDEAILREAQAEGVEILRGERVTRIEQREEKGWRIETRSRRTLTCGLLIGADGIRSIVARQLGLSRSNPENRLALRCFLPTREKNRRFIELHLLPRGSYVGIDVVEDYEVNFSIVLSQREMQRIGDPVQVIRHCFDTYPYLAKNLIVPERLPEIEAISPVSHMVTSCIADNAVLIGDAGGFIEPLTGEGIAIAIKTAAVLSEHLIAYRSEALWSQRNQALKAYERTKTRYYFQKKLLSGLLQRLIRQEHLCTALCHFIGQSMIRRKAFIGIINNTYTPLGGLYRMLPTRLSKRLFVDTH